MSELNANMYFRVAFLALLLPYVSGDCIDLDLGMENGTILDSKITASSVKSASTPAGNGRLNYTLGSSWCAATSDSNPYLQIDLQTLHIICAVSTQGNSQADQWVKTYKLKLSTDGSTWTNYKEGGQVKTLTGNEDKNSEVKHILYEGVFARYLQFLPETRHGEVCLRTELFGVKLKPENLALEKPTLQSSTFSNALIGSATSGRAVDGNPDTNMDNGHCSQTNTDNPSWWRVDLGSDHVPVSQIYIVNRFSPGDPTDTSKDYKITVGSSTVVATNTECKGRYSFIKFKASALCFVNPLTTGRYVGIMTTRSQALQLCEVEIYSRENLAFGKVTDQSSLAFDGVSSRGVDGNSATSFGAGSCTHTATGQNKPWWRVDLGKVEHVTEVYIVNRLRAEMRLSNFEIRVGTRVANGGVTNPTCGSTYNIPDGKDLSFFCHPSWYGRYVTIRSLLNAPLTLCEVEVYSERRACPMQSIGVASKDAFPDSSFSASSTRSGNEAFKGRLYGDGAWSPSDNNNASDYLQIDLLYEFIICAVATQGKFTADHWTTKYKLQLSYDGSKWVIYQENNTDKAFNGNSGREDIVKHSLKEYASARFIRFQPTNYSGHKALRVEVFGVLVSRVPSQAPSGLTVAASTSTSITASWRLPPENARHGNITGFKLFYKGKDSAGSLFDITINDGGSYTKGITGLSVYTEYEFQVLAFTSKGDGPKSSVVFERTMEDAPDVPATLTHTNIAPDKSHGPKVNLIWSEPIKANGIIRNYTLFYGHKKDAQKETFGKDTLSYSVDVLGGLTYQFSVRAVTIKPGENVTVTVDVPEYEPSVGPDNVIFSELDETTFNISWAPLTREKSYGNVILYDVKEELVSRGKRRKRSISSRTLNTTTTFVVLYDLTRCSQYHVSVRAYTNAGPGPYSQPMILQTSRPEPPRNLKEKHFGTAEVTLEWTEPNLTIEGASYTVKYSGTKSYNENFKDDGLEEEIKSTTFSAKNLVPGSQYVFEVYASSVCGKSSSAYVKVETRMEAPIAPVVVNFDDVTVTESVAEIYLWPVEQRNGPISAYQVIVLKVVDGAKELPDDYNSKLEDGNNANEENLNFYIAAEIPNAPEYEESWKFTVGDETAHGGFVNKALESGREYVIFQRALTHDNGRVLKGEVGKVARIVFAQDVGGKDKNEGSDSLNPAAVAVPVVLLLLILAALIVVVWYRRKKQSQRENKRDSTPCQLDDIQRGSVDTTTSSVSPIYQNMVDFEHHHQDVVKVTPPEEKELVYSEAEDGKPKPIPVAEFAKYFRNKSSNGAIVLREEFKNLPSGLQFPWEVGKNNRAKNRYGNITSYDHSRVVLKKIEGDPNSDYINASYMPTFDDETMCYIATQGPTQETLNDFWRMIWQENCCTIVMLTNLVEMGKKKCDQYWPDSTTQCGSIRVTLQKTENFADYIVRTFVLLKDSEKRVVLQFHYVTWPDKGVPERSTALLGFRWKVHARHQATGGPLVVHCSAGVGRTGTYIGIDAMLEGAEVKKSVFIQNYVQVLRRCRPYMVQKEEQYVFLHQAVMEALTCGNTEIAPQDLRIAVSKLARAQKSLQRTGFAKEFKRLELVSNYQSSDKESEEGFKPSSINKNRFPNIVPLDSSRVLLSSSEPEKSYINASFADGYKQRGAYILTQAPLDNTIEDFWCMISQYEIGTIVMLNSLKEDKESYPQYWPAEGSAQYGSITLQILSEKASKNITTRKFSVSNEKPPRKQSTVQHVHFTGWSKPDSCPDPKEILDLFAAVQHSQQQTGNGIIVFQCSDGVGRSGCVSSIMSVIDRVKSEQTVDVFQTVKLIRARRPGAVDTLDRYQLCYKTIQAYLDSFSTYANFAEC